MWFSGGRAEFERRVQEHLPDVLRLAQRLSGNPQVAEEVAQMALLKASRAWRSYRADASFKTWLFRIVINAYHDERRKAQLVYDDLPAATPDHRQVDPTRQVMMLELDEQIRRAVARLPPRQREVLVLSVYEQFGTAEIASTLNISVANVHANLSAARQQLREILKPYFAEP